MWGSSQYHFTPFGMACTHGQSRDGRPLGLQRGPSKASNVGLGCTFIAPGANKDATGPRTPGKWWIFKKTSEQTISSFSLSLCIAFSRSSAELKVNKIQLANCHTNWFSIGHSSLGGRSSAEKKWSAKFIEPKLVVSLLLDSCVFSLTNPHW